MKRAKCVYFQFICLIGFIGTVSAVCDRPRIPINGLVIEFENNDNETFPTGFEINVECDEGYVSSIHGTKCVSDNWASELDDCTPIVCSDPGIPNNGARNGDSFNFGDEVTFSCDDGYHLIGSSERVCQNNGRWTGSVTICDDGESDCADPGIPDNSLRSGDSYNVGDVVVYSCKEGYTMFGKNATRECLDDGHWTGQPIECYGTNEFSDYKTAAISIIKALTMIARRKLFGVGPAHFNVIFIVDASERITNRQYNHAKEFIRTFVNEVEISPAKTGVNVGIISYDSRAKLDLHTSETDTDAILNVIEKMHQTHDNGSNLVDAVKILGAEILTQQNDSKSIIFLISDGHVTGDGDIEDMIQDIQIKHDVFLIALAVGSNSNKQLLRKITPNVLMFSNFKALIKLLRKSAERKKEKDDFVCGVQEEDHVEPNNTHVEQPTKKSKHSLSSIVGGQQATKSWPWIVAFVLRPETSDEEDNTTQVFCGGTIIHKDWVVSAAHCFFCGNPYMSYNKPENWRVVAGKIDVIEDSGLEFRVKEIHCHPDFTRETLNSDIALVKLATSIRFDYFIRPICLPPYYEDLPSDTGLYKAEQLATVIGWGKTIGYSIYNLSTYTDEPAVTHLNEVEIPIQSEEVCLTPLNVSICHYFCENKTFSPTELMVCAGGDVHNACHGDSGGPFMQKVPTYGGKHVGPRWFLSGIVSWGLGCAQKGFYGYYAHVSRLRSYINNVTKVNFEDIDLTA